MNSVLPILPIRRTLVAGLFFLGFAGLAAQNLTEEEEIYVDSMFFLAAENKVGVFDTLLRPVSNNDFRKKYIRVDTCVNDQSMRPRYIDLVYYGFVDGVVIVQAPHLDTVTWKKDRRYIEFRRYLRDQEGNPVGAGIETAFLLDRRAGTLDARPLAKQALRKVKSDPTLHKLYQLLTTGPGEYWGIEAVTLGSGAPAPADSCQQLYRLRLGKDMRFEHAYAGHPACATADMAPQVEVSVEGESDLFFEYHNRVMGCYIANPSGIWAVDRGDLLLMTLYGREIARFKIEKANGKTLDIAMPGYRVNMKKIKR